jgi:hypothetical protein
VPFHLEISHSFKLARAFNLTEEAVRHTVVDSWLRNEVVLMGDRKWKPSESDLKILEGPKMTSPDLAMGQGWTNAERVCADVTAKFLRPAPAVLSAAVLATSAETHDALVARIAALGVDAIQWAEARSQLVAGSSASYGRGSEPAMAALLACDVNDPGEAFMFDCGLALGALGARAIVVQVGDTRLPPELGGFGYANFDPANPERSELLAERLRGCLGLRSVG